MNNAAKEYCKHISKCLSYSSKLKKKLLPDIELSIKQFIEDNPSVSYEDIVEEFGTPQDMVKTFLETEEVSELEQSFSVKRRVVRIVALAVIAVIVIIGIYLLVDLKIKTDHADGQFIEVIQEDSLPEDLPVYGVE
jgi:hypothetical protein